MTRDALAGGALIALFVGLVGAGTWAGLSRAYEPRAGLPVDTLAPVAAAAPPDLEVLGLVIGRSTVADVNAFASARGLSCRDASMAKIMEAAKAAKAAKAADATAYADGAKPDATTGASSRRGRQRPPPNPQVRISCEHVDARLVDASLSASTGRLLFVFDGADAPLRLVAFQRTRRAHDAAAAEVRASLDGLARRYGPPPAASGDLPEGDAALAELAPVARTWRFDGLEVRFSAINYGRRGTVISQEIGLPPPVRVARR